MFYVGQKVVCVDDRENQRWLGRGRVYTVSQVGLCWWIDGAPCIRVAEIRRGPLDLCDGSFSDNTPFYSHRFRPVVERKTDISIFKRMLTPTEGEPVA